jgi:hypothetical protein
MSASIRHFLTFLYDFFRTWFKPFFKNERTEESFQNTGIYSFSQHFFQPKKVSIAKAKMNAQAS